MSEPSEGSALDSSGSALRFCKFQKIYESADQYGVSADVLRGAAGAVWTVQEKVHGSNFSVYFARMHSTVVRRIAKVKRNGKRVNTEVKMLRSGSYELFRKKGGLRVNEGPPSPVSRTAVPPAPGSIFQLEAAWGPGWANIFQRGVSQTFCTMHSTWWCFIVL